MGAPITMSMVQAREQMIEQQVRAWDVLDARVLETLRKVPRDAFVPPQHRFLAFADVEIPLPCGQHMLRPSVAGRLLQALALMGGERVLEVGTGSGFVTACLRTGGAAVRSVELFPELVELARRNVASLGLRDVDIAAQDATRLDSDARYDVIAITASLPLPDERFQHQLAVGGRLFVVVGEPPVMEARLIRRITEDAWGTESLFETVIDPLVHATRPQGFVF
jgi:protein-L-isoaspartate(D-aspartate) O-methyltransferase